MLNRSPGMSTTANSPASSIATTSKAMHKFLHLRQPLSGSKHPNPRVLQPGHCYKYPFLFVIPQHLLPQACTHDTVCSSVKQAHLQPPPSLEDTAPGDFRISYAVRVVLSKVSGKGTTKVLSSCARNVHIVPAFEKSQYFDSAKNNTNICTRLEQNIKRGFERRTMGRMVVEASPANPVLRQSISQDNMANTIIMHINLLFDPVLDAGPPQPKEISAKLHTHTFYATVPWEVRPSWTDQWLLAGRAQEAFTKKTRLASFGIGPFQWTKHIRGANGAQIENAPKEPSPDSSTSFAGDIYYTASVVLPIVLPKSETQVPTFHSCLLSRTYDLKVRITHNTPKSNLHMANTTFKVPLNVLYTRGDKREVLSTEKEEFSDHVSCVLDSCDNKNPPPTYASLIRVT